ncbi:MAG: sensor histidine kinase N-terminal domain-containing protein [Rhodoferax sp.]|nr:sensor histidine kinase [Rhodoferax sp.]MDP3651466.1 sensor histidine kinase N-terminal domain-containing protein [Rhodoferax sp.]
MRRWFSPLAHIGKLRNYLLAWTLGPIALFMAMDTVSLYQSVVKTTAAAHDRLLRATAQQMGDLLRVERNSLTIHVPLALIEALEGAGGSRMYWRVIGFDGRQIAGDGELPLPQSDQLARTPGLSYSYIAQLGAQRVQVTALHQPVEMSQGQGLALILVGETLEAREATASALLWAMLARQLLLMGVITFVTWLVVNRALRPLIALRNELKQRAAEDTSMLASRGPEELQPVIDEMNQLLARQHELLQQQRRFVADASHQLRTPLTVLKTQLQSVLCGDAPAQLIIPEMLRTVDRTTHLANQLLNQARLEQMRQPTEQQSLCMDDIAREAVLEMSPLIAAKHLEFSLEAAAPVLVLGNAWMAGELVRNLLANAIRHSPLRGTLGIRFTVLPERTEMVVWDGGPGIDDAMRAWLFQPFAAVKGVAGAGLGLAICLDIATSMHARIELVNTQAADGTVLGLHAVVTWEHPAPPA